MVKNRKKHANLIKIWALWLWSDFWSKISFYVWLNKIFIMIHDALNMENLMICYNCYIFRTSKFYATIWFIMVLLWSAYSNSKWNTMGDLTSICPTLVSDRNSVSVQGTETDTEFRYRYRPTFPNPIITNGSKFFRKNIMVRKFEKMMFFIWRQTFCPSL